MDRSDLTVAVAKLRAELAVIRSLDQRTIHIQAQRDLIAGAGRFADLHKRVGLDHAVANRPRT